MYKLEISELIKAVRKQSALSQEDPARGLGVGFATVNRWENGKSRSSKPARAQFDFFCAKIVRQGKLSLPEGDK